MFIHLLNLITTGIKTAFLTNGKNERLYGSGRVLLGEGEKQN
jgi:hypothetical protein